jgi:hypothetical protein
MPTQIEELLARLEEVSVELVDRSDPMQVIELVRKRGELIRQLKPVLAVSSPVSYAEWNRLVVIHHQGHRIFENLTQMRARIALEIGANASGRLFLDRMTGFLPAVDG